MCAEHSFLVGEENI